MFRAVGTADLARHAFQGQHETCRETRNLSRQGLIRQKTCGGKNANPRELLTLTKEGSKLLRTNHLFPEDQAAYYGFVKPKEAQSPRSRPSYRIQTQDGEAARVDLELVTEHYRPGQLADKARAGFSLYASPAERDHLRRVLEQQELTAEILTL